MSFVMIMRNSNIIWSEMRASWERRLLGTSKKRATAARGPLSSDWNASRPFSACVWMPNCYTWGKWWSRIRTGKTPPGRESGTQTENSKAEENQRLYSWSRRSDQTQLYNPHNTLRPHQQQLMGVFCPVLRINCFRKQWVKLTLMLSWTWSTLMSQLNMVTLELVKLFPATILRLFRPQEVMSEEVVLFTLAMPLTLARAYPVQADQLKFNTVKLITSILCSLKIDNL